MGYSRLRDRLVSGVYKRLNPVADNFGMLCVDCEFFSIGYCSEGQALDKWWKHADSGCLRAPLPHRTDIVGKVKTGAAGWFDMYGTKLVVSRDSCMKLVKAARLSASEIQIAYDQVWRYGLLSPELYYKINSNGSPRTGSELTLGKTGNVEKYPLS